MIEYTSFLQIKAKKEGKTMKQKFNIAFTLAVISAMLSTSLALADQMINKIDGTIDAEYEVLSMNTGGPDAYVNLYFVPQDGDGRDGCNFHGATQLAVHVTSSNTSVATINQAFIDYGINCNYVTSVKIHAVSTGIAYITLQQTYNDTGGTFDLTTADFTVNVVPPPNTPPGVSVTGVTGGAIYEIGSVPAASCSVYDAEDGTKTVSPVVGPVTGLLAAYGLGSQEVTCSYTDSGGLTTTASATYEIVDTYAPSLILPSDITKEAAGAFGAAVTYTVTASDAGDPAPVLSCSPTSGSTFPFGTTAVNCSATDAASNTASGNFNVTVQDKTSPIVTVPSDITAEATGPSGAAVSFSASASDLVDGLVAVSCLPASGSTFALGTTLVTCSATDIHNNTGTESFNITVHDTTPPTITYIGRTLANAFGWNNSDVTVNWSCADNLGAVADNVSATVSIEGVGQSATGTCRDNAGNTAQDTQSGINIDMTPPVDVRGSPNRVPDRNGWYNHTVDLVFGGTDALSGIATCVTITYSGPDAKEASVAGTCTDVAGNTSAETVSSVFDYDTTPPTLNPTASPNPVVLHGSVVLDAGAMDVLSGVAMQQCAPVDTGSAGTKIVTCTATDYAGNSASAPLTVVVQTSQESIQNIIADVQALVYAGNLNKGQGNALIAKLDAAIKSIDKGNITPALNQLQAFINQVNAFIRSGQLTPSVGQALIDAANAVINSLRS
jgi:hypothetical protein